MPCGGRLGGPRVEEGSPAHGTDPSRAVAWEHAEKFKERRCISGGVGHLQDRTDSRYTRVHPWLPTGHYGWDRISMSRAAASAATDRASDFASAPSCSETIRWTVPIVARSIARICCRLAISSACAVSP